MCRGGWMGECALSIPQISGDRDQSSCIDHPPCGLSSSLHLKRDDTTTRLLLLTSKVILRMRGQTGIVNPFYTGLLLEPLSDLQSIGRVCLHPDLEGLHPLQDYPCIECTQGRTGGAQEPMNPLLHDQLPITQNSTPQNPSLSIEILGCRVDHTICPHLKRPLQDR